MRPLLIFTLEIYISIQLYKATQIITIRPPSIVCFEIVSFINNHTQKGPNENSKSIKKVTSEAKRYLVAKIKTELTKPDKTPPHKKHNNKSLNEIEKLPKLSKNVINTIKRPEIKRVGSISTLLYFLTTIANPEKHIAVSTAKRFPRKSPVSRPSLIIINIPIIANNIIIIVLNDNFSFKRIKARKVVINGIELRVNKAFAIEVLAMA